MQHYAILRNSTCFTKVIYSADEKRIEEVGKQRACAEWLVRCGAHVRWEGSEKWERDYNNLPPNIEDNFKKLKIAEVSAVDANVMFNGFVYFGNQPFNGEFTLGGT